MKSENLNFLVLSGPLQARKGTYLPFYCLQYTENTQEVWNVVDCLCLSTRSRKLETSNYHYDILNLHAESQNNFIVQITLT